MSVYAEIRSDAETLTAARFTKSKAKKPHRHAVWLIAGGAICWCYQCGAWRPNTPGRFSWHKPTGDGGANPALGEF